MIKVVEGELIRTLDDGDLENLASEVKTGYVLILVKENGKLHEGYVFVDDGRIIGSYYTDNKSTEVCGDIKPVLELLKYEDKIIELYGYTKDKMNLMKWLYPEVFEKKSGQEKKEENVKKEEKKEIGKEKYMNIKLSIPLDNLLEINAKDFEKYLSDNKYIVINAYRKTDGVIENGYVIYKGKTPIAMAYERDAGVLLGENAVGKIEELLKDENTVIDVYEYDEKTTEVVLEVYPQMKLAEDKKEDEKDKEKELELDEKLDEDDEPIKESLAVREVENIEETELSRDELLKKLGIKEPDEEWVDTILDDVFRPPEEELEELKKKIEEDIVNKIKKIKGVGDVNTDINVKWENGRYYIFGDINIKRRRIFGIIRTDVEPSLIKVEVDAVIKKYIPKSTSRISINVE